MKTNTKANTSTQKSAWLACAIFFIQLLSPQPLSAQIALEIFDYGPSYPVLPGQNGGSGFGGAWTQTSVYPGGNLVFVEPGSLIYPHVPSAGEKMVFFGGNTAGLPWSETVTRPFSLAQDNKTLSFYYLYKVENPSQLYYTEFNFLGSLFNLRMHFQNINPGDDPSLLLIEDISTGMNILAGTNLIYGEVTLGAGNDALNLWLNPDLLALGPPGFSTSAFDYGSLTGIRIIASSFDDNPLGGLRYDEILVVPEPGSFVLLLGALVFALLCRKRVGCSATVASQK